MLKPPLNKKIYATSRQNEKDSLVPLPSKIFS
jgi:hypothetical protein